MERLGGYFQMNEQYSYDVNYRSAYYVVRVPAAQFDALCQGAGELCTQVYLNRALEDVSELYYDTESRLAVARTKHDRLLELLAQAQVMTDIIELENALAEAEYEIEQLTGTLRQYDSLINYSTVTIHLDEVYRVSPDQSAPLTFGEKVGQSFRSGMERARDGVENFALFIIGHIVGIIIVLIIIAVIVLILRALRRCRTRKKTPPVIVPPSAGGAVPPAMPQEAAPSPASEGSKPSDPPEGV